MPKFKHEQPGPDREQVLEKAISTGAQKAKRLILKENLRITPWVLKRLTPLLSDVENKHKINIDQEKILEKALEELTIEQGALPENLQEKYTGLIAKRIADRVSEGEDPYELLRAEGLALKKKNIDLDFKKIEEKMMGKLAA